MFSRLVARRLCWRSPMRRTSLLFFLMLLFVFLQIIGCRLTCFVPPTITGQPSRQTIAVGQPAFFTLAAAGSDPLSYQWLKDGVAIPGATQASYVTPSTSSSDSDSIYTVTVKNEFGTLTSSPASLTVVTSGTGNVRF